MFLEEDLKATHGTVIVLTVPTPLMVANLTACRELHVD